MLKHFFLFALLILTINLWCQKQDSIKVTELPVITVEASRLKNDIDKLEPINQVYIYSAKKNEVVMLNKVDADVSEKIARQIFAKVPGLFVYDMEGSNQVNISTRGLDPHRAWEINLRKDGIIINSDMYGYPASHYSIPYESVERIEFVRGTFALQYGQHFGGMLNYVTKHGDTLKPLSFESIQTIGSYDLLNSYNAIGGKYGKIRYYTYYSKKTKKGYRLYEETNYDAQGVKIDFEFSKKLLFNLDWVRSNYIYRPPGPLNDSMFKENPKQATRFRNYFSPTIQIPSFTLKYKLNKNTLLKYSSSVLFGERKSVLFDKPATVKDTINTNTMQFNNRQVDIDRFKSFSQELRILHQYSLANKKHFFLLGLQLLNNHMRRNQLGKGTTGIDYNLTLVTPGWGRELHYRTNNYAFFTENSFNLFKNLTINAGLRFETGVSNISGKIVYYPEDKVPVTIKRNFLLPGGGFVYKVNKFFELYGSYAQSYRPMLLKDLVPSSIFEKVDSNITDARGYNAELGIRNFDLNFIKFDITAFLLEYNKRFGTLVMTDTSGNFYTLRTNIGNSLTKGIEAFVQFNVFTSKKSQIIIFTSTAIMDGRYTSGKLKSGNNNVNIKGNKIESVPEVISRNGITYIFKQLSFTFLSSYTGKTFADPLNTLTPNVNGTIGLVPAYTIFDFNMSLQINKNIKIKAGINNITNRQYFTKRPVFYPGPGIWPSDGRNGNITIIIKI